MSPSILVSTPDLRPSLLSILQGLAESGLLARVATTISLSSRQIELLAELPLIGRRFAPELKRRQTPAFLAGRVDRIWWRELLRTASSRIANPKMTHAVWEWAETNFDRIVARRYGGRFSVVYGMEHSSAATFAAQKARGGLCVLRQVTANARTLNTVLRRETARFPELVTPYHRLLLASGEKIALRKQTEYDFADLIVANSNYVRKTFIENGMPATKVVSVPTGCPPVDHVGARSGRGSGALRFLYVGALSLRKGLPYLLEAWRSAKPGAHAELWIAGNSELDVEAKLRAEPCIRYLGMLPRDELCEMYRQADVFVLPTLCEGLAHAVLEGLSFGLPVITTEASGAGDLVVAGENGIIVRAGDAAALASAMTQLIDRRAALPSMGARSVERALGWTREQSNSEHLKRLREFLELRA
jgi:glycosyltransferase involved in cell wall biosynthesis